MLDRIFRLWHHNGRPCGRVDLVYSDANVQRWAKLSIETICHPYLPQATGYTIDADDWHKHVHHALPYDKYLHEDTALRELLQQIPLPKYVFTNGDKKHAEICLRLLGIADCFRVSNHAPKSPTCSHQPAALCDAFSNVTVVHHSISDLFEVFTYTLYLHMEHT